MLIELLPLNPFDLFVVLFIPLETVNAVTTNVYYIPLKRIETDFPSSRNSANGSVMWVKYDN